jgi:MFS family permease
VPGRRADRDPIARSYHRSLGLRWLATVLPMPALVPLLLARGLELSEVGLVLATFAAVAALLELPTGGLADAIGRVRVTLIADALAIAGRIGLALAPTPTAFIAAAAVAGAARALGSGALEAWYVEARRRRDPGGDLQRPLARAGTVQSLAIGLGTLVGGGVPLLAPALGLGPAGGVTALQLPFWASALLGALALVTTVALRDADAGPLAGRGAARPDRVVRAAWQTLRADASLAALIALGAGGGALTMAYEAFFPAELAARWGSGAVTAVLGAAFAGAFVATALGQTLGGRTRVGRPGRQRLGTAALGCLLAALATLALAVATDGRAVAVAMAVVALWLVYLGLGLAAPSLATAFHERTPSDRRAALLSLRSLAAYAGGVGASLALGALGGTHGLALVWMLVAAIGALVALGTSLWRPDASRFSPLPPLPFTPRRTCPAKALNPVTRLSARAESAPSSSRDSSRQRGTGT